jgi:hypothetical protein
MRAKGQANGWGSVIQDQDDSGDLEDDNDEDEVEMDEDEDEDDHDIDPADLGIGSIPVHDMDLADAPGPMAQARADAERYLQFDDRRTNMPNLPCHCNDFPHFVGYILMPHDPFCISDGTPEIVALLALTRPSLTLARDKFLRYQCTRLTDIYRLRLGLGCSQEHPEKAMPELPQVGALAVQMPARIGVRVALLA